MPFIGGAKFAAGVSYENGQWDAGILIENDLPAVHAGKMLGAATVDIGYQPGDFESAKGQMTQSLQVGAGRIGGSVSTGPQGGFEGASIRIGPQLGAQVSGQQSRAISIRNDVAPWVERQIDRVKQWFK